MIGLVAFGLLGLATLGLMLGRPEPKRVPVRIRDAARGHVRTRR